MNTTSDKFSKVPAAACRLAGGEIALGDNGDNAKTAKIQLKARSGKPITHWYWGKVVHDLAGMSLHKSRLTVDYAHNDSEVLGYLNHFDASSGDLVASGALTPFTETDRASEVLHKMKQGVPYEASIFFGGEGIEIEEIGEGQNPMVNGAEFQGPGIIIRKWPLRGVAICPYGADQNTEAAAMSFRNGETFTATRVTTPEKETVEMSTKEQSVEAKGAAEAKAVEAAPVEAKALTTAAPAPAPVATPAPAAVPVVNELAAANEKATIAEAAYKQLKESHDVLAAKQVETEKQITALTQQVGTMTAERDEAKSKLAALEAGAKPVSAVSVPEVKPLTPWQQAQKRK